MKENKKKMVCERANFRFQHASFSDTDFHTPIDVVKLFIYLNEVGDTKKVELM